MSSASSDCETNIYQSIIIYWTWLDLWCKESLKDHGRQEFEWGLRVTHTTLTSQNMPCPSAIYLVEGWKIDHLVRKAAHPDKRQVLPICVMSHSEELVLQKFLQPTIISTMMPLGLAKPNFSFLKLCISRHMREVLCYLRHKLLVIRAHDFIACYQ